MRLSNGMITILKKVLFGCAGIILIITLLQLVFIGKNLTFTTKFTPQQSQQNRLKNQTYITEAQVLLIFISILNVFLVPLATYSGLKQPKKAFIPILVTTLAMNGFILFLNLYFLIGAGSYTNFMNKQHEDLKIKGICQNDNISLCLVGNCVRHSVFEEAKRMAIAYTVLESIFLTGFGLISIVVNNKKKDPRKMQLIV